MLDVSAAANPRDRARVPGAGQFSEPRSRGRADVAGIRGRHDVLVGAGPRVRGDDAGEGLARLVVTALRAEQQPEADARLSRVRDLSDLLAKLGLGFRLAAEPRQAVGEPRVQPAHDEALLPARQLDRPAVLTSAART